MNSFKTIVIKVSRKQTTVIIKNLLKKNIAPNQCKKQVHKNDNIFKEDEWLNEMSFRHANHLNEDDIKKQ